MVSLAVTTQPREELVAAFVLCAVLTGCAHTPVRRITMEPIRFEVQPSGEVQLQEADTAFAAAGEAFSAKRYDEAISTYESLVEKFPGSHFRIPSLYNAGLALEAKGDFAAAADHYRRLLALPETASCSGRACEDVLDAQFRLGFVYGELKNWSAQAGVYRQVLDRKNLALQDRLEAQARYGVAQFQMRDFIASERTLRAQLDYYRLHELDERIESDFFVGMAAYYLGEIAHEQYKILPVRLPEKQMAADLEAKAQLVLQAQHRYLDTIRVKNPEWATAAGFQIGSLYREFYDDLVGAPVPPELDTEAREIYLEEVRKKVQTLLKKAVSIHEKNLLMAERSGVSNEWVTRSNGEMEALKKLLTPGPAPVLAPDGARAPALPEKPQLKDAPLKDATRTPVPM